VLDGISFQEREGEFLTVIGPSGCGKSTLLRLLGALELPDSGEVRLRGVTLTEPSREICYVFQRSNLMPWRTVLDNVALPLEVNAPTRRGGRPGCALDRWSAKASDAYPSQRPVNAAARRSPGP
jgi:NitT/TauT family transport system ATP-binding protein